MPCTFNFHYLFPKVMRHYGKTVNFEIIPSSLFYKIQIIKLVLPVVQEIMFRVMLILLCLSYFISSLSANSVGYTFKLILVPCMPPGPSHLISCQIPAASHFLLRLLLLSSVFSTTQRIDDFK